MIAEDTIKEALVDSLGGGDREGAQGRGGGTWEVMLALVGDAVTAGASVVVEANFVRGGDVEARLATRLLFGMLKSITEWYRPRGSLRAPQIADAVFKIAFEGLE